MLSFYYVLFSIFSLLSYILFPLMQNHSRADGHVTQESTLHINAVNLNMQSHLPPPAAHTLPPPTPPLTPAASLHQTHCSTVHPPLFACMKTKPSYCLLKSLMKERNPSSGHTKKKGGKSVEKRGGAARRTRPAVARCRGERRKRSLPPSATITG